MYIQIHIDTDTGESEEVGGSMHQSKRIVIIIADTVTATSTTTTVLSELGFTTFYY